MVHLFKGVWSPSCAAFAQQTALSNHNSEVQVACKKATWNFCVDLLFSLDSTKEVSLVAQKLHTLLASKGFRLTKWISNHKDILTLIPIEDRHSEVKGIDLNYQNLPTESALGIQWDLQCNRLAVHFSIKPQLATKRGMLTTVSLISDPLGFVGPYTIQAKVVFQGECRRGTKWEEPLVEDTKKDWENW